MNKSLDSIIVQLDPRETHVRAHTHTACFAVKKSKLSAQGALLEPTNMFPS